jgi:uncharacterized protein (TIGR03083 family)
VSAMSQTVTQPELRTLGALYEDTRQRLINLVREATFHDYFAAANPVPACSGWRVRDVIAHLSGLATDIASGNIDGAATDAWTAAQVDSRRDLSMGDLLAESDDVGPQLASFLDDFPGRFGAQVVADITVHEHDIRGGLQRPGARDSAGVVHCVDFLLTTFVSPGACALGTPPLHIKARQHSAVVGGTEDSPGDPTAAIQAALATWAWPPDREEPTVVSPAMPRLEASPFELLRAFTGRRSLDQVHQLGWSVDPASYDGLFGLWPFTPQPTDLLE